MAQVDETRVVVLKPGDVLAVSNAGGLMASGDQSWQDELVRFKEFLGLREILVFADDVDLSKVDL